MLVWSGPGQNRRGPPAMNSFDLNYVIASLPALLDGLAMTVIVSAISISLATLIGIAGASFRIFETPVLSSMMRGYVEFIRNTPLLVQIFFIFFGLPSIGFKLSPFGPAF